MNINKNLWKHMKFTGNHENRQEFQKIWENANVEFVLNRGFKNYVESFVFTVKYNAFATILIIFEMLNLC